MTTPTVNVNLNAYCDAGIHCRHDRGHSPIPIPCPIPRTVVFEVRLGECLCTPIVDIVTVRPDHRSDCPARPIRVTCTISGETWVTAYVSFIERADGDVLAPYFDLADTIVRKRWDLMKALVLGSPWVPDGFSARDVAAIFEHRDVVFAALAAKARAEHVDDETTRALVKVVPSLRFPDMAKCTAEDYLSARALATYVESLRAHVAVLS